MKQLIIKILKSRWFQYFIVILIIIFLLSNMIHQCSKRQQTIDNYSSISDSLEHYKNKHGEDVARIGVIESERNKDFLKLKSNDSTIKVLQQLVKDNKNKIKDGGSATIITTTTTIKDTISVYIKGDTTYFEDNNEWIELIGQIIGDSLQYHLMVNNPFTMVVGKEDGKEYVEFTCLNPYTSTKTLRTYTNTTKKRHVKFGLNIGLNAGWDILHGTFYTGPGGGIGLIINF